MDTEGLTKNMYRDIWFLLSLHLEHMSSFHYYFFHSANVLQEKYHMAISLNPVWCLDYKLIAHLSAGGSWRRFWGSLVEARPDFLLLSRTGRWRSKVPSPHAPVTGWVEECTGAETGGCPAGVQGSAGGSGRVRCWSRRRGWWTCMAGAEGWPGARVAGDALSCPGIFRPPSHPP